MTKPSQVRPSSPATSLNHRLVGYSATAVAAMLTAPAAHAQTVTNLTLGPTGNVFVGGVHADSVSFSKATSSFGGEIFTAGPLHAHLNITHFGYGKVGMFGGSFRAQYYIWHGFQNSINYAGKMNNLLPGAAIAGGYFRNQGFLRYSNPNNHHGPQAFGNFNPAPGSGGVATGYVGFKAGGYYGWLHVQVARGANGFPSSISFVDSGGVVGAYGAAGITVGQAATAIPEPAAVATGLALFALGAVGVREHRRRKLAA